jgi:hypothetical protein
MNPAGARNIKNILPQAEIVPFPRLVKLLWKMLQKYF